MGRLTSRDDGLPSQPQASPNKGGNIHETEVAPEYICMYTHKNQRFHFLARFPDHRFQAGKGVQK